MGLPLLNRTSRPGRGCGPGQRLRGIGDRTRGADYRRPRLPSVAPKPPPEIAAWAGAMLGIERIGVPPALLAALKHAAALHSPQCYEREGMRFSTWDAPRCIRC